MKKSLKKGFLFSSIIALPAFLGIASSCSTKKAITSEEAFLNFIKKDISKDVGLTEEQFKDLQIDENTDPKELLQKIVGYVPREVQDFLKNAKVMVKKNKDDKTIEFTIVKDNGASIDITVSFENSAFMPKQIEQLLNKLTSKVYTTRSKEEIQNLKFNKAPITEALPKLFGINPGKVGLDAIRGNVPGLPTITKEKGSLTVILNFAIQSHMFRKAFTFKEFNLSEEQLEEKYFANAMNLFNWDEAKLITYGTTVYDFEFYVADKWDDDYDVILRVKRQKENAKYEYYTLVKKGFDNFGHVVNAENGNFSIRVEKLTNPKIVDEIIIAKPWGQELKNEKLAITINHIAYDPKNPVNYETDFEEIQELKLAKWEGF